MKARIELTDELLHQALRVERLPIPVERRAAIRQSVAAAPRRLPFRAWTISTPLQPAWLLVVLGALMAAMAAITAGSWLLDQRVVDRSNGSFELRPWDRSSTGPLRFQYQVPDTVEFSVESVDGVIGFAELVPGLSYGYPSETRPSAGREARGVVVADVTGATFHSSERSPRARDAATFLAKLDALVVAGRGYDLGPVNQTEVAGFPALVAEVSTSLNYPFLEMGGSSHVVNLGGRSRLIVGDIEGRVVLIQIWAGSRSEPGTGEELERWLPLATEFVNSFVLDAQRSE